LAHHAIQPVPLTRGERWGVIASIASLAVIACWPAVFNDFAYDDRYIILSNGAVHELHGWWRIFANTYWPAYWGGDGYRPLTILAFAIEWAAGAGRPGVFHMVNIGLYAAMSVAVFCLAECCLPLAAAWVAAALFAVHPVHVEVVANVVGQSELLAGLCLSVAVTLYVRWRNAGVLGPRAVLAICALYAAACLSKEHGVVLPGLLFVAELTIVADKAPLRARLASLRLLGVSLCLVAVAYLGAHVAVSAQTITGFQPYAPFSALDVGTYGRVVSVLGVAPQWLRLLLWPARLSPEYGPPADPVVSDFQLYQLPGIILVVAVLALGVTAWKRHPAVSFGIWFMAITLLPASNLLFPAAGFMSERTLFAPSIGAMIAVAAVVPWAYRSLTARAVRIASAFALALLVAVGAWRSSERSRVWKNNKTLFEQAVVDAPNVYRSHLMLGAVRFNEGRNSDGERELSTAILLYDRDPAAFILLGEQYRKAALYQSAGDMFQHALLIDSTLVEARARLALSYAELGRWPDADREARRALAGNTIHPMAMLEILRLAGIARRFPVSLREHPLPPEAVSPPGPSR
jgi:hypothetical protein